MDKFDVIIIGGGPAGYLAGERAGQAGLTAAVIEKRAYGGVCLNEGCIPSKALLNSAKLYEHAKDSKNFGVSAENVKIDQNVVIDRKNTVVKTLVSGVEYKLKKNKVSMIRGAGKISGRTAEGFVVDVDGTQYLGEKLLIAAGSVAMIPPISGVKEGLDNGFVVTNREIFDVRTPPERLIVIGGGVIGLEMASYYNCVGSQVTVIEMLDQIGGPIDSEIAQILKKEYTKKGITFELSSKVTAVGKDNVSFEKDGKSQSVSADMVLLSVGRRAAVDELGLDSIGIHTEKGAVVTDPNMRTNVAGVYAAGDINGRSMLAHTAYREAEVAINHILGKKDYMRYNAISSVIYTTPEVAAVGETEKTAKEKSLDITVAKLPMSYSGRYLAEVDGGTGIAKLIMDNKRKCLVGVHLIGSYASEIIYGAAMMIEKEMLVDELKEFVVPHPTVSEIIRETLFEL